MSEELIGDLEKKLINLGEDVDLLEEFKTSYKLEFGEDYPVIYAGYLHQLLEDKYHE